MLGNAPGNSQFDLVFLIAQGISILFLIYSSIFPKSLPAWSFTAVIIFMVAAILILPLVWYLVFPPLGGLDGAGRIIVLVPAIILNLIFGVVSLIRLWK